MADTAFDPHAILELASWQDSEKELYERFVCDLLEVLGRADFRVGERPATLREYLDWHERPTGDERQVVDALVSRLLHTLGFRDSDVVYNEPGSGGLAAPDFTVRVPEFLGSVPVFLVEDKATSVLDFQRGRRQGADAETPIGQIRRYVLSGAVNGRTGLLCNGWKLEAWEFGPAVDTRLAQIDLYRLGRGVLPHELTPDETAALRSLWGRYSREAYERAHDLADLSHLTPPLPPEWRERVRVALAETGSPSTIEAETFAYYEEVWRAQALDVSQEPERLVEALRGLIQQFAEDVRQQLEDALSRHAEYEVEVAEGLKRSKVPQLRQRLALHQPSFTLSKEEFEAALLFPVDEWSRRPDLDQVQSGVAEWLAAVEPYAKVADSAPISQITIDSIGGENERPKRPSIAAANGNGAKRILLELRSNLEDLCRAALEDASVRQQLDTDFRAALRTADAYRIWVRRISSSVLVGQAESRYHSEFALQTAYVYIVRLLLVRICEDKGLFRRKLSDGGLVAWAGVAARYLDYASGRSYEYLTRMAYDCAANVYVHFYGASELFDWYRMDEKMLVRALRVLNVFDLRAIDTDIIGAVYGRYLKEGKHEQGRYYTPKPLVTAMLDLAGYQGPGIVGRRIADLACGSGSFLVEACRRLLTQFRAADGTIPAHNLRPAIEEIQRSIYGLELNPFACYLAETNLLIQVLDLVRQAQQAGETLAVGRFRIYCADSLVVEELLAGATEAMLTLLGDDAATAELIKARSEGFEDGFDFLVGNPPYVRADEPAPDYQSYRRRLEKQPWFTTAHLKWDLYVPFVEQYWRTLAAKPDARCCLVTIESIATAPYAANVRELLITQATLHEILFLEKLKLFEEAAWQNNVVFCFSQSPPHERHKVSRSLARSRTQDGSLLIETLDSLVQTSTGAERAFSFRVQAELDLGNTIRLEEICYVTKGMVLHSHEKFAEGQIITVPPGYYPGLYSEEVVEERADGSRRVRHRSFGRDDLIADQRDTVHTRPYLSSREVRRGGIGRVRWLEYGPETRCPSRVSRPTFPELFERTKLMFGGFTGVAVDDGGDHGFLMVADKVRIAIKWSSLTSFDNRSLAKERRSLEEEGRYDPPRSEPFSEWYLAALVLSEPIQSWLHSTRRSMKEDVYPDDIRAIPIKVLRPGDQQPFIGLEQERHRLWRELVDLEADGFRIGVSVELPVHSLLGKFRSEHPEVEHVTLFQAAALSFRMEPVFFDRDLSGVKSDGDRVVLKRQTVARVDSGVSNRETVAALLARVLGSLPGTFAGRQALDRLPRTEAGLLALAAWLDELEAGVRRRQERIDEIQAEIDRLAWALYRP